MIQEKVKKVMQAEQSALSVLMDRVDDNYDKAVQLILNCKGKVIFAGIGKSGHIGKKLAATFSSTGTPSFFVHCAECFHGDFGMVESKDVVILISNSGTTREVVDCMRGLCNIGCAKIAVTKNAQSPLALGCDCCLLLPDVPEADHLNLAPTVSSTATLVLGDALACTVSQLKNFTKEQFHTFHPGGALGKQLSEEK